MPITVVSLNTQHCLQAPAELIGSAVRDCGADIALFQEVDSRALRSRMVNQPARLSRHSGLEHAFYSPSIRRGLRRYGLLMLSRYPLLDRETVNLPRRGVEEPRIAQFCTIDAPCVQMKVVNVHLPTNLESGAAQFRHLLDHLGTASTAALMGGDFNGQPVPGRFLSEHDTPTWPWGNPRAALDRILVTPDLADGAEWEMIHQVQLSDHTLILVKITSAC